jgi:CarD family transcriptional regulator
MSFGVGSDVVYPAHGMARVIAHDRRTVNGISLTYLVIFVPQRWGAAGGMTIAVPEERAASLGVRAAISEDEACDVLAVLAATDVKVPSNWSRRFKNHQEKMRSGDVYQCAEVVRNLGRRARETRLSHAESRMYERAHEMLVSELAVTWGTDEASASRRVDEALGADGWGRSGGSIT